MASLRPMIRPARQRILSATTCTRSLSRLRTYATASDARNPEQQQQQQQRPNNYVRLVEVGPRDGLQNEKKSIPVTTKIELIEKLAQTGLSTIEAGSFVSPRWVPQMNNSGEILEHLLKHRISSPVPLTYSFLAPNMKGIATATAVLQRHPGAYLFQANGTPPPPPQQQQQQDSDPKSQSKPTLELAVFAAATETFSHKNLNCSIADSLARFKDVIHAAKQLGARARAYISVVLGCPFEGYDVDPQRVAGIATDLLEMGADEISLGDTTGMGTAPRTAQLLKSMTAAGIRNEDIAMHFHDTYGQALVNTAISLEHGVRTFDCAVGGLGGCPYSPGATGNVATENMVYFLESLGMDTGVDLDAVADIGQWITSQIGKPNDSAVGRAVLGARQREQQEAA